MKTTLIAFTILYSTMSQAESNNFEIEDYLPNTSNWMQAKLHNKKTILEALQTDRMTKNESMLTGVLGNFSTKSDLLYHKCNSYYIKHSLHDSAPPALNFGLSNEEFNLLPEQSPYVSVYILNECGRDLVTHLSGYIVDIEIDSKKITAGRPIFHETKIDGYSQEDIEIKIERIAQTTRATSPPSLENIDFKKDIEKLKSKMENKSNKSD